MGIHMVRCIVHYTGRVQGVGFRYTARQLAEKFVVAGTVENLSDGRVKMVVEGETDQVDGLMRAIAERMVDNIHEAKIDRSNTTMFGPPRLGGLVIRY